MPELYLLLENIYSFMEIIINGCAIFLTITGVAVKLTRIRIQPLRKKKDPDRALEKTWIRPDREPELCLSIHHFTDIKLI